MHLMQDHRVSRRVRGRDKTATSLHREKDNKSGTQFFFSPPENLGVTRGIVRHVCTLSLSHTHSHTNFHIKKDCLCNKGALSVVRQRGLKRSASFRWVQSVTQSVVFALNQLKELQCWVSVAITKNPLKAIRGCKSSPKQ